MKAEPGGGGWGGPPVLAPAPSGETRRIRQATGCGRGQRRLWSDVEVVERERPAGGPKPLHEQTAFSGSQWKGSMLVITYERTKAQAAALP